MFWETFCELCTARKIKPGRVAKEIGVSNSATTHWKYGKVPHYDTLLKIASYFGVSVDYLIGGIADANEKSTLLKRCITAFSALPEEKQQEMVALLEFVKEQAEKK